MTYEEAMKEAEANITKFPQGVDEHGMEWVMVDGLKYPKDWLLRTAARMKSNGEI